MDLSLSLHKLKFSNPYFAVVTFHEKTFHRKTFHRKTFHR